MKKSCSVFPIVPLLLAFSSWSFCGSPNPSRELLLTVFNGGPIGGDRSFATTIQILNLTENAATATLSAYTNDGVRMSDVQFISNAGIGGSLSVGPRESAFVVVRREPDSGYAEGWIKLAYEGSACLRASSEVRLMAREASGPGGNRVVASVQIPAMAAAGQVFAFPRIELFRGRTVLRNSAYAFVNPDSEDAAHVTLTLRDTTTEGGQTLSATLDIAPNGRVTALLSDLLPGLIPNISVEPSEFLDLTGSLRIDSDTAIAVGGIDLLFQSGALITGLVSNPAEACP